MRSAQPGQTPPQSVERRDAQSRCGGSEENIGLAEEGQAVSPGGKLATAWGQIKDQ